MTPPVLLDTHALVWWVAAPEQLSRRARSAVDGAESVAVSAASGWELALLVGADRLMLDRPVEVWLHDVMRRPGVRELPIDLGVAAAAAALARRGFHRDLADRFLYATAARERLLFVSKDAAIGAFAHDDAAVTVVW